MHEGIDALVEQLTHTAEWRDKKAAEYPDDTRNSDAAAECRRHAAAIPIMDVADLLAARLRRLRQRDWDLPQGEAQSEFFRAIGFHNSYQSAGDFLEAYVSTMEATFRDLVH